MRGRQSLGMVAAEPLEARRLFWSVTWTPAPDFVLTVCGDEGDDTIHVYRWSNKVFKVDINGVNRGTYAYDEVNLIKIYGGSSDTSPGGGNDNISIDNNVIENSYIFGGTGADTLSGGGGIDEILGSYGTDTVKGNSGDDILDGDSQQPYAVSYEDRVEGGVGDDLVVGGYGDDTLVGGQGNDTIDPGGGDDLVYGDNETIVPYTETGNHNDTVYGGPGEQGDLPDNTDHNTVYGGLGDDDLSGGGMSSVLYGDFPTGTIGGNDTLFGYMGDTLYGGPGDDWFRTYDYPPPGEEGHDDWIFGGDGFDTVTEHGDEDHISSDVEDVW